jgi:hypothetical protein
MAVMPLEEARARIEMPIPLRRAAVRGAQPPSGSSRRVLVRLKEEEQPMQPAGCDQSPFASHGKQFS